MNLNKFDNVKITTISVRKNIKKATLFSCILFRLKKFVFWCILPNMVIFIHIWIYKLFWIQTGECYLLINAYERRASVMLLPLTFPLIKDNIECSLNLCYEYIYIPIIPIDRRSCSYTQAWTMRCDAHLALSLEKNVFLTPHTPRARSNRNRFAHTSAQVPECVCVRKCVRTQHI